MLLIIKQINKTYFFKFVGTIVLRKLKTYSWVAIWPNWRFIFKIISRGYFMLTKNSMRDFDQNMFSSLDAAWPGTHRQDFLKPLILG